MRVAICDDDKKDIKRLGAFIEEYGEDHHIDFSVAEYDSGRKLINDIMKGERPEIIFLDINMADMDGLTVAKRIREDMEDVPIILVTAYMNYALEGYKVRASRFLVKDELERTISEALDDTCREIRRKTKKLSLSCVEGDTWLNISDIILIETCAIETIFIQWINSIISMKQWILWRILFGDMVFCALTGAILSICSTYGVLPTIRSLWTMVRLSRFQEPDLWRSSRNILYLRVRNYD